MNWTIDALHNQDTFTRQQHGSFTGPSLLDNSRQPTIAARNLGVRPGALSRPAAKSLMTQYAGWQGTTGTWEDTSINVGQS
jgi:hypothetical protein